MPTPDLGGERPSTPIGLGLGSNIGDKPRNIRRALELVEAEGLIEVTAVSSIYRTAPWGYADQDFFANACALARTRLAPLDLLAAVKNVEREMGRESSVRWGPRLIDIDILFYGNAPYEAAGLQLPHKNMFERAFVLIPLAEVAPDLRLLGRSVREAAERFAQEPMEKWESNADGEP